MTDHSPRRVLLGRGFAGDVCELSGLKRSWSCAFGDLPSRNPFAALHDLEASLAEGDAIAGWIGYECAIALEPSLHLPPPPVSLPIAWFGVFGASRAAADRLPPVHVPAPTRVDRGEPPEVYQGRVQNIRQRITRGDVFQVNYSHRQTAEFAPSRERLIDQLPWPDALDAAYGAFFDMGEASLVSASPELFLSLEGDHLVAEPVKGTRRRRADPARDEQALADLKADPKDRAENIMITDLLRNDLSKVSKDGTVREPVICGARTHAHVHHLYSQVEGRLRDDLSFADALAAAFPCGSVTGAPKLAAMEAIAELEGMGRGPYCGAVIYRPHRGKTAASVAIRTAVVDERVRTIEVRSGGGVTILSDPEAEYREAIDKGYLFRHLAGQDDSHHR
ncbi:MAG: anthranilate synthase component I family protein [Pseudomonadota bacterium]